MMTGMSTPMMPMYLATGLRQIALKMPGVELKPSLPPWRPIVHSAQQMGRPMSRNEIT